MVEHEELDELAHDIELAIRRFDRALERHEATRDRTPSYEDTTSIWGRVKDVLHG